MAKFSLARVPYYIAVAIFMALTAVVAYVSNTTAVGVTSDFHLAVMVAGVVLGGASLLYAAHAKSGGDDEVDLEVASLPLGKAYYYIAVLAVAAYRGILGYQMNHTLRGMGSTYGILWLLGSLGIAAFTWANYKSYKAGRPSPSAAG